MTSGATQQGARTSDEERRRSALESSGIGTWELDLKTDMVACDPFVPELFGLPRAAHCPMRELLARVLYEDAAQLEQHIELARCGGHRDGLMVEYRVERAPLELRWIEAQGRVAVDANGEPARFTGTMIDITDRKQAELERTELLRRDVASHNEARDRIQALAEELQRADRRKDELLAMLGHELRNPMAAISTSLHLLARAEGDAGKVARYQAIAGRQMDNLVRLVDDLLDVARISHGKVTLRREQIELAEVVRNAIALARPEIDARKHHLEVFIAPGAYPMNGDTARLEQVVVNLLTNAAKYTDEGGSISIDLTREPIARVPHAILRVIDNGRGVPKDMVHRIFDMFVQVDPGIERSGGGLGVGLTLVKSMVEQHGGRVIAISEGLGKGTKLVVRLPLDELELPVAPRPALPRSEPPQGPRKVVIVEDSVDTRIMLKELLESVGHEVEVADDGVAGAERVALLKPDAAVIDIGLPLIDGYEVARRVRAQHEGDRPLLIALTGYGGADVRAKAEAAGFDLHFTKPVDLRKLFRAIERGRDRPLHQLRA
jgi:PAS domain S-box-containing protein